MVRDPTSICSPGLAQSQTTAQTTAARYRPAGRQSAPQPFHSITVFDNGKTGMNRTSMVDSKIIPINVRPVNDPPLVTIPTAEDGSSIFFSDEE